MVKGLPFPTGVGWQSSPGSSLHFRKHIQKVQAAFATGGNPKARVWRRNAINTAETRQSLFKKQPARSQTGCRLLFAVNSADYLPRWPRPWFKIRWISTFISRMISCAIGCTFALSIAGMARLTSSFIILCFSKILCPTGES